jgi:hypothetical protein
VTGIKHLRIAGASEDEREPAAAYTQLWAWHDERWLRTFQETPIVEPNANEAARRLLPLFVTTIV